MGAMGKLLIVMGLVLVGIGAVMVLGDKLPFKGLPLGRLPGDIVVEKGNFRFYFPWVSCLVISVVLTLLLRIFFRR